jgi:hypothetical protein
MREQIYAVDAVYWAVETSSVGVDEKTYDMTHVNFPMHSAAEWASVSTEPDISFHAPVRVMYWHCELDSSVAATRLLENWQCHYVNKKSLMDI